MSPRVVIVGAGAAGLWAAATAARAGADVIVLEKTPRAGTKILASGGSRCNLTTTLDARGAARLFGPEGEKFLWPSLRVTPPAAVVRHFARLGVPTVTEPALEKVFPASQRAVDVRDALQRDALSAGAHLQYGAAVTAIEDRGHTYAVGVSRRDGADVLLADRVILCSGGCSVPKSGTTGDGYGWLRELGLSVVPPVPALVPLASPAGWVHELSGIALPDVEARLVDPAGRVVARRRRPVLFTHHGLSGPGAMDLSGPLARARHDGDRGSWTVAIDTLPDLSQDELRARLLAAAGAPGGPHLWRVVGESLPARVRAAITRQAGVAEENPPLHRVERKHRNRLVDALKGLVVPVAQTLGFDAAEVTAGGLALDEVDRGTMQVHSRPGLFVCGELLDVDGPIGGLNFQAAFATAELAGRAAATGPLRR